MHQIAVLDNDAPTLNKRKGDEVKIEELESHYKTSAAAKVNKYKCANQNCGVFVTAVIPQKFKLDRQKSPSAYFTAKPVSHLPGCNRMPLAVKPGENGTGPLAPHSSRGKVPTKWIDPEQEDTTTGGGNSGGQNGGSTPRGINPNGHTGGTGQNPSVSSSNRVERFASEWLNMGVRQRRATAFNAPWNPSGSYYSAFYPIKYFTKNDITTINKKIVVARIGSIFKGRSGYTITLKEKESSNLELKIWVQNITFTKGIKGKQLEDLLENNMSSKNIDIYALGEFLKQISSAGNKEWLSLIVTHPSSIWIDV